MTSWEQDPEMWKNSSEKDMNSWEDADAWKFKGGHKPGETSKKRFRLASVTIGIRPTVPTLQVEGTLDIIVKNRDALKLISTIFPGQKATTEDGEVFQFSIKYNMWVKIPWDIC